MSTANSTSLDDRTIQANAILSRISQNLTPEEIENYHRELEPIIDIAKELNEVNTENVATTDGWRTFGIGDLRPDETTPENNQNENYQRIRQNIITNWTTRINPKKITEKSVKYGNLLSLPGIFAES